MAPEIAVCKAAAVEKLEQNIHVFFIDMPGITAQALVNIFSVNRNRTCHIFGTLHPPFYFEGVRTGTD